MKDSTELIPIASSTIGGAAIQTVNARDLHAFLGVGKKFASWIVDRIEQFGFIEGVDFIVIPDSGKNSDGRPKKEYAVSIGMAKELCMVERNAKGKEARLYFIECERQAKAAQPAFAIPQTYPEALRLAADLADKNAQLIAQAEANAPKVEFTEDVTASGKEMTITAAAKTLGIGPKKLFDWLRQHKFLYSQSIQAMQTAITRGLMVVRFADITRTDGSKEKKAHAHVTGKGLFYFYQALRKEGLIDRNPILELAA